MTWFTLARVLFVAAVAYAAAILQPVPVGVLANVGLALTLSALVVFFEARLRETAITRILGALIGCAIGLAIAHTIVTALFWADNGDRRVEFLHSFALIVLPYLGLVLGSACLAAFSLLLLPAPFNIGSALFCGLLFLFLLKGFFKTQRAEKSLRVEITEDRSSC